MKKRFITIALTLILLISLAPLIVANADTAGALDHLVISPVSANVVALDSFQFTADAQDSNNVTIPGLTYEWSVVAGGGTIDNSGNFTAGNVTSTFPNTIQVITAQNSTIKIAYATVTVIAPQILDHVVISPKSASVVVLDDQQFTADAQDSNNVTIPGLAYEWSVVAGGGTINNSGNFTAGNVTGTFPDTIQVIATQNSTIKIAYATVTVIAPQVLDHVVISPTSANVVALDSFQFTADAQDSNNVTIPELAYEWSVVVGGGTIDNSGNFTAGNVSGVYANTVRVSVTQGSITKTAFASVTITAAPVTKSAFPPGFSKGEKKGWEGGNTPPGWSKGEKKGWENGMPPGLAKKSK